MMTELVAERAQEGAKGRDFLANRRPHPHANQHGVGGVVAEREIPKKMGVDLPDDAVAVDLDYRRRLLRPSHDGPGCEQKDCSGRNNEALHAALSPRARPSRLARILKSLTHSVSSQLYNASPCRTSRDSQIGRA